MMRIVGFFCFAVLVTASTAFAKVGGGDITFTMKGAGPVVFTHDNHAARVGLKCSECHYRIFSTVAKHSSVTMAEMQQQGRSCGACHDGVRAFDVRTNCNRCHRQ
jgi:c(7)-type cytochrome triheme protein